MKNGRIWIAFASVLFAIGVAFGGAMLKAGHIDEQVSHNECGIFDNAVVIKDNELAIRNLEITNARITTQLENIDKDLEEIKQLIIQNMDN